MADWEDASEGPNTMHDTWVHDLRHRLRVVVSDDDEGPQRPAYYWLIEDVEGHKVTDGWAGSVKQAETDALTEAKGMLNG